jgi:hypothetical protein
VKPPTFGLPMSIQFVVLEIFHTWASWPFRVPTITILMTHFLVIENKLHHTSSVCDDSCYIGWLVPHMLE